MEKIDDERSFYYFNDKSISYCLKLDDSDIFELWNRRVILTKYCKVSICLFWKNFIEKQQLCQFQCGRKINA